MTVVSSKEFVVNDDKYFDLALDEKVYIQKENNLFILVYSNVDDMNTKEPKRNKPSDFFGTLSVSEGEEFHKYVNKSRLEWDRNI